MGNRKKGQPSGEPELKYEPYPLIGAEHKRRAKTNMISLAVALTPRAHLDGPALVIAWLPGGLRPSDPKVARCEGTLARFERAFEKAAQNGEAWLPRELGEAAAELSEWPEFKALFDCPGRAWSFLQMSGSRSSSGRSSAPRDELGGRLERGQPALQSWASERLGAFVMSVEPLYFGQLASDPAAMDERLERALRAQEEARGLERSIRSAPAARARRPGGLSL